MALPPPVKREKFSFAGDSLFVEASGNNLHRRATIPELHAHFNAADGSKDFPGHWYEAQLLHYGLPPSKTKGTAKMRLFDAVKKGGLAVPSHLLSMEADLKKLWRAQESSSKKPAKAPPAPVTKPKAKTPGGSSKSASAAPKKTGAKSDAPAAPTTTKKRKAPSADLAPSSKNSAQSTAATPKPPPAKKAKPPARNPTASKKPTVPKAGGGRTSAATPSKTTATPRMKQTARRGKPLASKTGGASRSGPPAASTGPPRNIQTARRGGRFDSSSRPIASPQSHSDPWGYHQGSEAHGDLPPSYAEAIGDWQHDEYSDDEEEEEEEEGGSQDNHRYAHRPTDRRLGLLNGRYDITCSSDGYPGYGHTGKLVLTLDGDELWGSIKIGGIDGTLRLGFRPYEAAEDHISFDWRGYVTDEQGRNEFRNGNWFSPVKWLAFPGDGNIQGSFQYGPRRGEYFRFEGFRVSGQETRSEISPWEMRDEWENLGGA